MYVSMTSEDENKNKEMRVCAVCLTENFDVRKIGIQTPEEDRRKTEDEKIFWKFEVKYFSRKCKCLADLKKKISA